MVGRNKGQLDSKLEQKNIGVEENMMLLKAEI